MHDPGVIKVINCLKVDPQFHPFALLCRDKFNKLITSLRTQLIMMVYHIKKLHRTEYNDTAQQQYY